MHSLKANWLNELEKLWARRRIKGFLLLAFLIPTISALALAYMQNTSPLIAGLGSDLPMIMLGLFTTLLLPLFLFMTAVDSFSGEIADRTLKLVLVRPIARSKIFASKVLALAAYVLVHLGAVWTVSVLAELLLKRSYPRSSMFESATAYAVAFVPMFAISLMAVLIAQRFRNSTGALALIILIYIIAKMLPFLFPSAAAWSVYSYTNWHTLWVGSGISPAKLFNTFAILLSYCIMAFAGGMMMFERKGF